jgi:hypothetical protein
MGQLDVQGGRELAVSWPVARGYAILLRGR